MEIAGRKISYSGIDFTAVGQALSKANYFYILPYLIIYTLVYYFRALRWKYFMYPIKNINMRTLFTTTIIGFMGNCILPARAGEVVRPVVIGIKEGVSKSASFATIVVERVFDLCTLLLFSFIMLMNFSFSDGKDGTLNKQFQEIGIAVGAIAVLLILFLVALKFKSDLVISLLRKIFFFIPDKIMEKLLSVIDSFIIGLGVLQNVRHLIYSSLLSLAVWLAMAASFYSMFPAFNLNLPFSSSFLIMILIALGVAAPSSPGFIGIYQVACEMALKIVNVEPAVAKSYAIAMWTLNMIPTIIAGLIFLWTGKLKFSEIQKGD
ncbi:MAG: UPF0104 family protein [Candidatus Schekmanbacteria bacterium]|nr:MAG: UPF0104 family protein [Candidatus Schekmanbacteria bacterium]